MGFVVGLVVGESVSFGVGFMVGPFVGPFVTGELVTIEAAGLPVWKQIST